jgi:5-methylcytosine-specific restriction enzyme subunit McrC
MLGIWKMNRKYYCISEYGYIASRKNTDLVDKGSVLVEESVFEELEQFVLYKGSKDASDVAEFLSIGYKRGIGKILKAQNYVGLIQTKSGVTIEILPKLYDSSGVMSYEKTIKLVLKMLKSLKDSPFKKYNLSSLKTSEMNILDIFISMFLTELGVLIKRGLKSSYIKNEDNLNFYKGKLNVNEHIKHNFVHKEKFYLEYDEYSKNRPENRLIKSTLLYLNKQTAKADLQKYIREYLFTLEEVEVSKNTDSDFQKCLSDRIMSEYDIILKWCRVFLDRKSFTNYKGSSTGFSLLFPMEKIFESYVAKCMKGNEYFRAWDIYTQHNKYYLIENPKLFRLRPDIVMEKREEIIVLDTKWKLLNSDEPYNYGISQSDLYQMYAYAKKYEAHSIILIYPLNPDMRNLNKDIIMKYEDGIKLKIFLVDLDNIDESMIKLSEYISL